MGTNSVTRDTVVVEAVDVIAAVVLDVVAESTGHSFKNLLPF